MYPIAFFSLKLSVAERNHDMGNRELLAFELALVELSHWLEAAEHPFQVLTDHKKLENIYVQLKDSILDKQDWHPL